MDTIAQHPLKGQAQLNRYNELVEATQDQVFRAAFLLTGNQQAAEDLTQGVYQQAYSQMKHLEPGRFELYLLGILAKLWRVAEKVRPVPIARPAWQTPATPELNLRHALSRLSPDLRLVVVLVDLLHLDYRQAARVIQTPVPDIQHRLALARAALSKLIFS